MSTNRAEKTMNLNPFRSSACKTLGLYAAFALLSASAFAGAVPPGLKRWPTIAEQMQQSKAKSGSALEKVIRENQEFNLLRPEEMNDTNPVPAWLRVRWRKGHPQDRFSATDPTGGYPLVLKEIWEWMMTHQDLKPGAASEPLPPGMASFGAFDSDADREMEEHESEAREIRGDFAIGANTVTAGSDRRMSGSSTTNRSESDIRLNYWNPQKIIAASNEIGGTGRQAQFYSSDGGATWGQTNLALTAADDFHSDPTVEWTSDGTAWSTTLGIDTQGQDKLYLRLYKSTDGGATWTFDSTGSGTQANVDKQMHWVDHNASSPYKDNQYVIYHNGNPGYMNRYVTSTGTWGTPIQVSGAETTGTSIGADVTSNAYGDVFGAWPDTGSRGIYIVKSTNGGTTYSTPVKIRTTFDSYDIGVPSFSGRRALMYVSIGAYRTANINNVYAVWMDLSGETGCTAAANEPNTTVASTCKTRIWFASSADGGTTWSAAKMLNNQLSLNDQFNQDLVVDEATGELAVIYYDTVASATRLKTDVYYQASCDFGATWSTPIKLTTAQTDETVTGADTGNQYGDYNGVSGYAGTIFPSWTDRRGGATANEEVWTAPVTSDVPVAPTNLAASTATGQIVLTWTAAPGASSYTIYRSNGACPGGTYTSIASGVTATTYTDTTAAGGSTYSYIVSASGGTRGCAGGTTSCISATKPSCTNPAAPGTLTASTPVNNAIQLDWGASATAGVTYSVYRASVCGGSFTAIATGLSTLTYTDTTVAGGTSYSYQIVAFSGTCQSSASNCVTKVATGGPGLYSRGRMGTGKPIDTATATKAIKWLFQTGASALSPPASNNLLFAVSNDRFMHSMQPAQSGGNWPAGWLPVAMNAPSQGRPNAVNTSAAYPGLPSTVSFVSSQDGFVYAVNGATGAEIWRKTTSPAAEMLQGTPMYFGHTYGGGTALPKDLVIGGTRNSSAANIIYAMDAANGNLLWQFSDPTMGIVNGPVAFDTAARNVYFATRARTAGAPTLWAIHFNYNGTSWDAPTKLWSINIGDIDGTPIIGGGGSTGQRLYVGNNTGDIYAVNPTNGALLWSGLTNSKFATGDGAVKTLVNVDFAVNSAGFINLYFATTNKVFAVQDQGTNAAISWSIGAADGLTAPSVPVYTFEYVLFGGSGGKLFQISSPRNAVPTTSIINMPSASEVVGSPTFNRNVNLIYVGSDAGTVYAVVPR